MRSLRTGRVLYARNAEKNLKPASTLKLVTTAAALDAFGPDARLRTTVETAGRLDGRAACSATSTSWAAATRTCPAASTRGAPPPPFEELADALRPPGVRRIEGRLVGHEGLFAGDRRGDDWAWGDLVWCYGAEVSALSFNDNCAELTVTAGEREGDPRARATATRRPRYYRVVSTATTSAAGAAARAAPRARPRRRTSSASRARCPLGRRAWQGSVALEDPGALRGHRLRARCWPRRASRSRARSATSSDPLPAGRRVLAAHDSAPLAEILKVVNKASQNLHAEMLLRLLGARREGRGHAWRRAARRWTSSCAASGVHPETWSLQDGSGLSRSDLVTAARDGRACSRPWTAIRTPPSSAPACPSPGVDGTLENRMKGTPARGAGAWPRRAPSAT